MLAASSDPDGLRLEQVFDGAQSSVNLAARVSLVDLARQQVLGASVPVQEFPRLFGLNRGLLLRDVLGARAVRVTPVNATMIRTQDEMLGTVLDILA